MTNSTKNMNNNTIQNFLKALEKIEERDFLFANAILNDDLINVFDDKYSTYENNFVTKLNEKYAILSDQKKIEEPKELIRQFQIPKRFAYSEFGDEIIKQAFIKIQTVLGKNSEIDEEWITIPDFIIHKNQKDVNSDNQLLIAEVKTEKQLSYKKFVWDFFKLNLYLEKLNFQNGIFLTVNCSKKIILSHLKTYIQQNIFITTNPEKLFLIIKEDFNTKEVVVNLNEYLMN